MGFIMMMYNTLKCFGEGRKKGSAINKILFYDQKHINDGCVGVIAHMYLQVIPPLGGSFTGKKNRVLVEMTVFGSDLFPQ